MLRGILGGDDFFGGIRTYYERHRGSVVTTRDLESAMSAAAGGRDLRWFFRQWTELPGYPVLAVEHTWDAPAREVAITIRQEQQQSWPTFRLPMEIEIVRAGGRSTRRQVELVAREQTYRFPVADEPLEIRLDPDGWVLKRMAGEALR
jgi:aminopeptidase N